MKTRPFLKKVGVLGKLEGCEADILTENTQMSGTSVARRPWAESPYKEEEEEMLRGGINIAATRRRVGMNEYINRDAGDEIGESLRPVLHLNGCWNTFCLTNK